MRARKRSSPGDNNYYRLKIVEDTCDNEIAQWCFDLDAAGLGALIVSIERATSESRIARAIGFKRKRTKP